MLMCIGIHITSVYVPISLKNHRISSLNHYFFMPMPSLRLDSFDPMTKHSYGLHILIRISISIFCSVKESCVSVHE